MSISAADVKALRERTNAPMMECKSALTEAAGDMDKAVEIIRKKIAGIQAKHHHRETAEGRVATFVETSPPVGAIVELRCESAPVANTDHFKQLAADVARQVALHDPADVDALLGQTLPDGSGKSVNDRISDVIGLIREKMKVQRFTRLTGLVGAYSHHDGSLGVLLQVEGARADPQLLRDVCMHVAARNPIAATTADVPAAVLDKEREIAREQMANDPKNKSKPANILDKILEGKLKTWLAENVLLEQPFVKDDSKTVGQLLSQNGLKLVKFVRYKVGEIS